MITQSNYSMLNLITNRKQTRRPISPPKQNYEMTKERFFEIKDAPTPCLIQPHYNVRGDVARRRFTYNGKREELLKGHKNWIRSSTKIISCEVQ